ncbi:MAG: hypothetical protein ACFBSC_20175 [Microcoleaceae cyanobacterium]
MKTLSVFALFGALSLAPIGAAQAAEATTEVAQELSQHQFSARTSSNSFRGLVSRGRRFADIPQIQAQELLPYRGSGR